MKNAASERLNTCAICRSETRQGLTDLTFDYGDFRITVSDVPVEVCEECDESYVDGPLGVALSDVVSEIAEQYAPLVKRMAELRGTEVRKPYSDPPLPGAAHGELVFA